VFFPSKDTKIVNKRNYPVVFVLNFDGSIGSIEEVFSLAKSSDK
jgi:hypothetical protein